MLWHAAVVVCVALAATAAGHGSREREPPGDGFEWVTCGSAVKLAHLATDFRLHSHEVAYGTGSGQQSVTMKNSIDDHNSLWSVLGDFETPCPRGTPIKCGRTIRLKHVATSKWLHSHKEFQSPMSKNQEVSAFGGPQESNDSDLWKVECDTSYWDREGRVRFKHIVTKKYLHSTGRHQFSRPISGQREVSAMSHANQLNEWMAIEGYYVKTSKP